MVHIFSGIFTINLISLTIESYQIYINLVPVGNGSSAGGGGSAVYIMLYHCAVFEFSLPVL